MYLKFFYSVLLYLCNKIYKGFNENIRFGINFLLFVVCKLDYVK